MRTVKPPSIASQPVLESTTSEPVVPSQNATGKPTPSDSFAVAEGSSTRPVDHEPVLEKPNHAKKPQPDVLKRLSAGEIRELEKVNGAYRLAANALIDSQIERSVLSDHLPIEFGCEGIQAASWNMLAHVHRHNNFANVKDEFSEHLGENFDFGYYADKRSECGYSKSWLFSDVADGMRAFQSDWSSLRKGETGGREQFAEFLEHWTNSQEGPLRRAPSKEEALKQRATDRQKLLDTTRATPATYERFLESCVRALKISNTVEDGSLSWNHRRELIKESTGLLESFAKKDFLTLQECTDPEWFVQTLRDTNQEGKLELVSHRTSQRSDDHCAVIYNAQKWELEESELFHLGRNKPAIAIRLRNRESGERLVVTSIHHPGSGGLELGTIAEKVGALCKDQPEATIMVAGDFNHTAHDIENDSTQEQKSALQELGLELFSPSGASGTMAGPDWDDSHRGHTIDLVLSNRTVQGQVRLP